MGWLIAAGILIVLALLPVGLAFRYHGGGARLRLIAGPVRVTLYPRKKAPSEKKPRKAKQKKADSPSDASQQESKGGSWKDFEPLLRIGLRFLNGLRKKLRVRHLELKLTLAGDDPCDLACNYGRANAALGNLLPLLEQFLVIKKRDLEVACDFTAAETRITARADASICLGRLLVLLLRHGLQAVKAYFKLKNNRKGGASK